MSVISNGHQSLSEIYEHVFTVPDLKSMFQLKSAICVFLNFQASATGSRNLYPEHLSLCHRETQVGCTYY